MHGLTYRFLFHCNAGIQALTALQTLMSWSSQARMITAKAISYNKKSRKNIINHCVLHSPPIGRKDLGLVGEFQNSHVLVCLPFF